MKVFNHILIVLIFCLLLPTVQAQRILLVEKQGKFKNYKYFVGDDITLRTIPSGTKFYGVIHVITDTSIVINFDIEIMLEDIEKILRPRWGFGLLSKITRIAGAGYFVIDVVNNAITGQPALVNENTAIASASLIAFSYALVPLHNRRIKPGSKWRIRVLNMSMDDEVPNPFLR